jgi:flagellin
MIINHNLSAIFAHRHGKFNAVHLDKNIEKLSSGMRINRGGDDPAGLAVSEKMRAQVRGLRQAARNTEDAISFIQTTEGYLQESQDVLHRIRELSIQAANGVYSPEDVAQIQVEVSSLTEELDRIATSAQFNGMRMLTGNFDNPNTGAQNVTASMVFHIGANPDQRTQVYIGNMTTSGLNLAAMSVSTPEKSNATIMSVDQALNKISKQRADLGAYQSRFGHAVVGLMTAYENTQAAESRIRDADMAEEMVDYVKNQILMQTSTAMLAQANMKSTSVLSLLS